MKTENVLSNQTNVLWNKVIKQGVRLEHTKHTHKNRVEKGKRTRNNTESEIIYFTRMNHNRSLLFIELL